MIQSRHLASEIVTYRINRHLSNETQTSVGLKASHLDYILECHTADWYLTRCKGFILTSGFRLPHAVHITSASI